MCLLVFIIIHPLFGDGKKIILQMPIEECVLLTTRVFDKVMAPWPYDDAPYTPAMKADLVLFDLPVLEEDITIDIKHRMERIKETSKLQWGLTLTFREKEMTSLSEEENLNRFIEGLVHYLDWGTFSSINWDISLSDKRRDYWIINRIIDRIVMEERDLDHYYSLNRDDKVIDVLGNLEPYYIIKAYDFSGRHSTLENAEEAIVSFTMRKGISPGKIILGIPMYGRKYQSLDPHYWVQALPYHEIIRDFKPEEDQNEIGNYYFNGPELVLEKGELVIDKNMAGVMLTPAHWDFVGFYSLYDRINGLFTKQAPFSH